MPCSIDHPSYALKMIDTSNQREGQSKSRPCHILPSCNEDSINSSRAGTSTEKYGLRPRTIIKRLQLDRGHQQVSKEPKGLAHPKSRPAPLSKYRRKTANARERHRMREINNAFESLRRVLPDKIEMEAASSSRTKITTLRLAADYIRALNDVLQEDGGEALCSLQCSAQNTLLRVAPVPPRHHLLPLDYYSPATHMAPSASRGSLSTSSCSDLEDLLSDDSCSLLDDNFDVFHFSNLSLPDPSELLLGEEKDNIAFNTQLCN
ncbi:neurogenic differentiation factor 1-like [Portunus trituberculatus]|uniref:Helix-loop-helix protein delilah n=1 Tax=Portunus trituberculatus TaxID=210409 RepID=A0A5B7HDN0_PORTR|nr:neurogenic differentiation factor 1-like [Portunus trituberculatus]MPC66764.1 Helix-loop-helix protein delilah [Portunus trituberculatus]